MVPGCRRTRVEPQTIRDWIQLYRASGFEGLLLKPNADQAKPRRMPPEVIEVVLSRDTRFAWSDASRLLPAVSARTRGVSRDLRRSIGTKH